MTKEHQEYVDTQQKSMDQERIELSSKHQLEIDNYKLQITKLTDEKNIAERTIQDLTKAHKTEKNAMIEEIEKRDFARIKEYEQKIVSLSNALETHKSKFTKLERDKQMDKEVAVREATVFDVRVWLTLE